MKKRVLFGALLVVAVAGAAAMPRMVESSIPAAYYITPSLKTYENVINCSGTIQSQDVRQVCLQSTLVAEEIHVAVGDHVQKGASLLRVDADKTEQMGLSLSMIRDISDDISAGGTSAVDWAGLASSYGLSTMVNGGSTLDSSTLESLLADSGILGSANVGTVIGDLEEGEITAPISGVVTSVDIQPDVPASAGKAIITVADDKNYKVLASVREEDIGRVQVGDSAKVRGVGFSGVTYFGTVTKIHPTARKTFSGTSSETVVDVEIAIENPDRRLKAGFTAKVEILGGSDYNLITVPYEAIKQDENNNEYVYLYEGGKIKKQVVVTGQELTNEVEILEGVSHDSVVVYNPADAVKEGAMVHIKGRADVD